VHETHPRETPELVEQEARGLDISLSAAALAALVQLETGVGQKGDDATLSGVLCRTAGRRKVYAALPMPSASSRLAPADPMKPAPPGRPERSSPIPPDHCSFRNA
jgi:hypothetical protein